MRFKELTDVTVTHEAEVIVTPEDVLGWLSDNPAITVLIAAAVAVVILLVLWKLLTRRKPAGSERVADLTIDVTSLGGQGPPPGGPVLEFYNVPVRLAALVLAPAGRVRQLPPPSQLDAAIDAIVPGLDKVVAAQRPVIRRWPAQLSSKGFAHTFFQNVRLPGEGGKGTPWCAAAGTFKIKGQPVMAGLIMRTASASSIGQTVVDKEEKWLGCLRVKGGS